MTEENKDVVETEVETTAEPEAPVEATATDQGEPGLPEPEDGQMPPPPPPYAVKLGDEVITFDSQAEFDVFCLNHGNNVRQDPARIRAARSLAEGRVL